MAELKVFVLGPARSGTSITFTCLRQVLGLSGRGESHVMPAFQVMLDAFRQYKDMDRKNDRVALNALDEGALREHLHAFIRSFYAGLYPSGSFVDKTPGPKAIRGIPLIRAAFPDARIVVTKRGGIETVLSFQRKFGMPLEGAGKIWVACMDAIAWAEESCEDLFVMEHLDLANRTEALAADLCGYLGRPGKAGEVALPARQRGAAQRDPRHGAPAHPGRGALDRGGEGCLRARLRRYHAQAVLPDVRQPGAGAASRRSAPIRQEARTLKVFLHIGAGKTGTSAIQAALAQNRGRLAEAGLHYPPLPDGAEDRAMRGVASSGNARILGWFCNRSMKGGEFTLEGARRWLAESIEAARGRTLLFSSEAMQFARPEDTAELVALFREAGYAPEVIFYARHLLDHAIAEYLQHVKMGFATLAVRDKVHDLLSFLAFYRCGFLRPLRSFGALLPREAVHVRLYDAERPRLVPNFMALLGLGEMGPLEAGEAVVNRSPSPEEVPLFEALARQPDGLRLCRALSDLLLNHPVAPGRNFRIPTAAFEEFRERNQAVLQEMNGVWLTGPDKLRMRSARVELGDPPELSPEEITALYAAMMATVLRRKEPPRGRPRPEAPRAAEGRP